jgi:Mrp family chromosome partitioning ATPase
MIQSSCLDHSPEDGSTVVPFIEIGGPQVLLGGISPETSSSPTRKADSFAVAPVPHRNAPGSDGAELALFEVAFQRVTDCPSSAVERNIAGEVIVFHQPGHAISARYRELWTAVTSPRRAYAGEVFALFGAASGVGTTSVTLNLAATVAMHGGRRVVVVDTALSAAASQRLGVLQSPGLREVLEGVLPALRVVQPTAIPGLAVLPSGRFVRGERRRIAGKALHAVFADLRRRFDAVFVDASTWISGPDAWSIAAASNSVLVVESEPRRDAPALNDAVHEIGRLGVNLAGCVLTRRVGQTPSSHSPHDA